MKNQSVIDFMKLRASFGIINTDNTPYQGYWYDKMSSSAGGYPVNNNFGVVIERLDIYY